jgi:hypothetical protein
LTQNLQVQAEQKSIEIFQKIETATKKYLKRRHLLKFQIIGKYRKKTIGNNIIFVY